MRSKVHPSENKPSPEKNDFAPPSCQAISPQGVRRRGSPFSPPRPWIERGYRAEQYPTR
jgi:hypothetical protein